MVPTNSVSTIEDSTMVNKIDNATKSSAPTNDLMDQFNIEPVEELEALNSMIFDSPDINQAKIDFFKEEIASGRYEIEPLNIATKLAETNSVHENEAEPA